MEDSSAEETQAAIEGTESTAVMPCATGQNKEESVATEGATDGATGTACDKSVATEACHTAEEKRK